MRNIVFKIAAIVLVLVGGLTSCKETVRESLQILIRNGTDSQIHVRLFPNEKYIDPREGFVGSDVGSGQRDTEFALDPNDEGINWTEIIYSSSNLDMEPHALASEVFDSIYICTANKDGIIIKFTHEKATGYSENIFSEYSTWNFEMVDWDMRDQHRRNPQKYYQYQFMILKEEMTNNQ